MPVDYLTDEEYRLAYGLVPRLCVDLVIKDARGVLLLKREQKPYKGLWHLPGGRVRKGETLSDASKRIAMGEIGRHIEITGKLGVLEFPHDDGDLGNFHSVSIVFAAKITSARVQKSGQTMFFGGDYSGYQLHPIHRDFLVSEKLIEAGNSRE
ncbi:MAG TPA: NUDIX domain-containing protein [Desulfosporosinus sp.]|nr:NUDIX domain-containing protein [Desulfosporosinus sp.]